MNSLPNDPFILMSTVNMLLRDQYASLNELCEDLNIERTIICDRLKTIGMKYDEETNRFW